MILTSRSRYFDAALSGAYVENQKKTVEIELADDQAVDDLRLLIKLSCGLSYVQDGDVRLPKAIRLRLAFLANALEFVECVQECLRSFSEEDLTLEEAFALLDDMPEELWEHDATILLMSKIVKILDAKVDEQAKRVKEGDDNPEDGAAAAVLTNKVMKALAKIIDTLAGGIQGQSALFLSFCYFCLLHVPFFPVLLQPF